MWRALLLLLLLLLLGCTAGSVNDYTIQFEGVELRVTEHLPPRLAVRDAVSLICRVESHRAARMRISPELRPYVSSHEFGGSKWHQSPVIAVNQLHRLVETLPSECTLPFFTSGQWSELRFLWGDEWASPASSNEPPPPPPPPYTMLGGGRCLDPESGFDEVCDLCFESSSGRVAAITPWSRMPAYATPASTCGVPEEMIAVVPVRGLVVSPGFISVSSLGGVSFARGRDAVMAGVTSVVDAIPGATDVNDWYDSRYPNSTEGATSEWVNHPHHYGVAVAAADRSGAAGANEPNAVEGRLRRGLAEGALAIALDISATRPALASGDLGAATFGAAADGMDEELLSRLAVARSYDVALSTGVSIIARGRRPAWSSAGLLSGRAAVEEQRLSSAQEIVANVAATGAFTLCLDTGCFPPAQNMSLLAQQHELNSGSPQPHLMGEGELRSKSLLELRSFAVELGVEPSRIEAARDSEVPPPKEAVLALLVEQQHLIAQERAAQVAAAELAAHKTDSGAIADAARLLSGAAARGVPLKVSGLGGGWDGVHHTLAASDTDCMLAAVEEATLAPASMLGLSWKGRLQVGLDADITVFDPSATTAMSAIRHVVVNGYFVVRDAAPTKALPGTALRHGSHERYREAEKQRKKDRLETAGSSNDSDEPVAGATGDLEQRGREQQQPPHGEDRAAEDPADLKHPDEREGGRGESEPEATRPAQQRQFREQSQAASVEAEQRERLKQRFGSHDGL